MLTGLYGLPNGHNVALKVGGAALLHTFSGSDSATSPGNADTGQSPSELGGGWGLSGGLLYCPTPAAEGVCVWDATIANGVFRILVPVHAGDAALIIRCSDVSNYIRLVSAGGSFHFQKRVATAFTTFGSPLVRARANNDELIIEADENIMNAYVGSTLVASANDAHNATETLVGAGIASTTGATSIRWNDLRATR